MKTKKREKEINLKKNPTHVTQQALVNLLKKFELENIQKSKKSIERKIITFDENDCWDWDVFFFIFDCK